MNPFTVLEISPDASPDDIKAAYHRLAKRWHPDRYTGDEKVEAENRFRELAEAFSVLKDPAKRLTFQQQQPRPQAGSVALEVDTPQERTSEDWAVMAKAAFEEGNNDQARALIYYAIRMDGEKPQYHSLLASILEKEGGDLRAVVKALETAVRLAPRDVDSHIRLALHFQTLGMAARSQRHLQAAREISPNHPKLRTPLPKGPKGTKTQAAAGQKGKLPAPPPGLLDQLKDLWGRLTGKG
ncbi:J domain-containing protein [Geothrix sp. PMB-07]|uniref:J domain-containing protein n=1 Tax=Geothrix sp. PMB-07 TaxID=3068640 RepID=UPI002741C2FE|nr:DnaJ domain-containing protein [Geothrix sp. PMB-07]WLT33142.1 DnaJ domain-containing protein [Geothrix sp. PMB-07]